MLIITFQYLGKILELELCVFTSLRSNKRSGLVLLLGKTLLWYEAVLCRKQTINGHARLKFKKRLTLNIK